MRISKMITLIAIGSAMALSGARAEQRDGGEHRQKIEKLIHDYYNAPSLKATTRAELSPAESEELRAYFEREPDNTLKPVDLSDPGEARIEDLISKAAGRPPFTGLAKALAAEAGPERATDTCAEILKDHNAQGIFADAGVKDESGATLLAAATLQAVSFQKKPDEVRNFGAQITVFDSNNKAISDKSGLSTKGQVLLLTQDPPKAGAVDEKKRPVAQAYFTVFKKDGTPCQTRRLVKITPPPKKIAVSAPNNTANRATVICLNRGNPEPQWPDPCDFGPFKQAGFQPGSANVVVPLAGNVEMPYPIAAKDVSKDVLLQVTAINSSNGETCKGQDNDLGAQVLAQSKVASANVLNWSILGDAALIFGRTCYASNTGLAFNMYWQIPITMPDGSTQSVSAIISNVLTQGTANTLIIRPAILEFGCLPGGTMVTLADGVTRKAVEDFGPQDKVLGLDGKPWAVTGHIKGEDNELIAVTTENGLVSRMTSDHPVITGYGKGGTPIFVMAKDLVVGTGVFTVNGQTKVARVEHQAYKGFVYNMEVRPLGASAVSAGGGGFFADGLLVGDQTMQGLATRVDVAKN